MFDGTCAKLCEINAADLIAWASAIPIREWPTTAGSMRTIEWRDAATIVQPYREEIMHLFPGAATKLDYFSIIFPGAGIAAHIDPQEPSWICRVHVPILTNPQAEIIIEGEPFHLDVGSVYQINTGKWHSVINGGPTPRLHWMFDVHAPTARL